MKHESVHGFRDILVFVLVLQGCTGLSTFAHIFIFTCYSMLRHIQCKESPESTAVPKVFSLKADK